VTNSLGECLVFTFAELSAKEMGSTVKATVYARSKDGKTVGESREYSVLTYAMNVLNKQSNAKPRTLLVDMLNYGAAAQTWFGYHTEQLVNAGLTEAQKAYATAEAPTVTSCKSSSGEGPVTVKGATLSLKDKVEINYYVDLTAYEGQTDTLVLSVTYTDRKGQTVTEEIPYREFRLVTEGSTKGNHKVTFDSLNATELRSICTATVRNGGQILSNSLTYSVESYAANMQGQNNPKLTTLLESMMKYGDATADYFAD
jgi:hypothetical protein